MAALQKSLRFLSEKIYIANEGPHGNETWKHGWTKIYRLSSQPPAAGRTEVRGEELRGGPVAVHVIAW